MTMAWVNCIWTSVLPLCAARRTRMADGRTSQANNHGSSQRLGRRLRCTAKQHRIAHANCRDSGDLKDRISAGHGELPDVRGADYGWNYGSKAALGVDLPSYPAPTGLVLVGLQGAGDLS